MTSEGSEQSGANGVKPNTDFGRVNVRRWWWWWCGQSCRGRNWYIGYIRHGVTKRQGNSDGRCRGTYKEERIWPVESPLFCLVDLCVYESHCTRGKIIMQWTVRTEVDRINGTAEGEEEDRRTASATVAEWNREQEGADKTQPAGDQRRRFRFISLLVGRSAGSFVSGGEVLLIFSVYIVHHQHNNVVLVSACLQGTEKEAAAPELAKRMLLREKHGHRSGSRSILWIFRGYE